MLKRIKADYEALSDLELSRRIGAKDVAAVRLLTGRNNQRLYRTAWSILKDRSEAEEAVQDGYMKAFDAIETFEGDRHFQLGLRELWLTRPWVEESSHNDGPVCSIRSRFSSWRNIGKS